MASLIALAAAPAFAAGTAKYVVEISVDAMHAEAIGILGQTLVPNLWRMRTEGAFTNNARTDWSKTDTSPNHFTMFTGRPISDWTTTTSQKLEGHMWGENIGDPYGPWATYGLTVHDAHIEGVYYTGPAGVPTKYQGSTGEFNKTAYEYVPSVMDVAHDAGLTTGLYYNKDRLLMEEMSYNATNGRLLTATGQGDPGVAKIDYIGYEDSATSGFPTAVNLMDSWVAQMESTAPLNLTFLHLDPPDKMGHKKGFSLLMPLTSEQEYLDSIIEVDGYLGRIFDLIDNNSDFTGKTAIILTADHGGGDDADPASHFHSNKNALDNYAVNFFVWGPGVTAGADLYALNPQYTDPGTGRPDFTDSDNQPIRNGDMSNLALDMLGLGAIPGSSMNFDQSMVVPEPATMGLLALGGLAVLRRRRARQV
jgi:hypothetical protein